MDLRSRLLAITRRPVTAALNAPRHNPATELRKEFGIEAARTLGHCSAAMTEVYAQKDEQQAVEATVRAG